MSHDPDAEAGAARCLIAGWDGRDGGRDAAVLGRVLAAALGRELCVLHVDTGEDVDLDPEEDLRRALAGSRVTAHFRAIADRSPARALAAAAESGAGMLILGSTHRAGAGRVFPGPVAERLLGRVPFSLAIAPRSFASRNAEEGGDDALRVLEVGFDGSPSSMVALALAEQIARGAAATIRVIAVGNPTPADLQGAPASGAPASAPPDLQDRLHDAVRALPAELRALPVFERSHPTSSLLRHAGEGVDLLLIGSSGHGRVSSALLGSTARDVVRNAPCPVVVIPH